MRSINRQQTDDWFEFINQFRAYENSLKLRELEDELLDLYSQWLKNQDIRLKEKIIGLSDQIKRIDPHLKFEELLKKKEVS